MIRIPFNSACLVSVKICVHLCPNKMGHRFTRMSTDQEKCKRSEHDTKLQVEKVPRAIPRLWPLNYLFPKRYHHVG